MSSILFAVTTFLSFTIVVFIGPKPETGSQTDLATSLDKLKSPEWTQRASAASDIIKLPENLKSTQIISALLDLLDRENRVIDDSFRRGVGTSNEYGEGYGGYYAALLGTLIKIVDFKNSRTLEILSQGSYNPDSPFAQKLADSGELVVPIAFQLLQSDIGPKRWNAVSLLGMVYEKRRAQNLSEATAERIKQAIVKTATDDSNSVTRQIAVTFLGKIGTTADIPLLERIARVDPTSYQRGPELKYPVREAAVVAINAIRDRFRIQRE